MTAGRWALIDPNGVLVTYEFETNPNVMSSPDLAKKTSSLGLSAVHGKPRGWRTSRLLPRQWTFSGVMSSQAQHDIFVTWFALDQRINIRDHFGRIWNARLLKYEPAPRQATRFNPNWRFTFAFTADVYGRVIT